MVVTSVHRGAFSSRLKDEVLDHLASYCNVAQFVSFAPDQSVRFARVRGVDPRSRFDDPAGALAALFGVAPERSVNVRSFRRGETKGQEFVYGLTTVAAALDAVERMTSSGLNVIVNETVDVNDGGVSGVIYGGVCEFAPQSTPRCVEAPGTAALPAAIARELLTRVYGFSPAIDFPSNERVEFSIHPLRRGYLNAHTIIWEVEEAETLELRAAVEWPNRFSRFLGDKAFGLLVADSFGFPVPRTTVIGRGLAPFQLGHATGTSEIWIRTCPEIPVPGLFTTQRGWRDPYDLLNEEDPSGTRIRSVLAQEGVDARYSGAAFTTEDGSFVIEGVVGSGEGFMKGEDPPDELPFAVMDAVETTLGLAGERLGPVRLEWVYDGARVWIVQLHIGSSPSSKTVVFPGEPTEWAEFEVERGIGALRELIEVVQGTEKGVFLLGKVGVTSHFGDLLRRARIPSVILGPG